MSPRPSSQPAWQPQLAAWSDALLPISLLPLLLHPGEQPIGMALMILAWLAINLLERT